MKAIDKGAPYMAAQKKQVQGIQQDAVSRVMDPVAFAEKKQQAQAKQTILGGGNNNGLGG